MEAFALYLFKSSVWLTGFALVYVLFLRNERFFTLNRIYLVSGILVSILFPLFTWHYTVILPVVPSAEAMEPQIQGITVVEESFLTQNILLFFYLSGVIYLIYRIFRQTLPVFRIIKKSETSQYSSAKLIRTDAYPASFSFFSFVFVNPSISDTETNEIVNHELEHIRQQHWIDLLLFEILRTMQWFNPVSWLYGHLIRQNHEYLADERALQRSSNPAIYRAALLNQMFGGPVISLANSFNYSLNKKRFTMMKHTIKSPFRKLKLLLVLPLIAGVFYAFATPEYKFIQAEELATNLAQNEKTVKGKVIDESGNPLKSASVVISGKTIGTITDSNGNFILKVTDDSPIVISYVGFQTMKIKPDFEKEMPIAMKVNTIQINLDEKDSETRKKEQIDVNKSNALVIVDGKEISKANIDKIQPDKVESVSVLKGETATKLYGEKGKDGVVLVTLKKDNLDPQTLKVKTNSPLKFGNADGSGKQPLIIIDGVVDNNQNVNNIPPENIESISVLKDKSATSLYGEKGKDGVILITTKKGKTEAENKTIDVKVTGFESDQKKDDVFLIVEEMPEFPGGQDALRAIINATIQYPEVAKETGIQGKVFVNFVVAKDGSVTDAKIRRGVDPSLDKEALRIVSNLPKWKPGKQRGEAVRVSYTVPVNFQLQEGNRNNENLAGSGNPGKPTFYMVEEMPQFPGGVEALKNYVAASMKYPTIALENGIYGQVFVKFVVDKSGNVTNAKVSRGVDPSLDKEALRVVESMPGWKPGSQNGENVDVFYTIPVNFNLPTNRPSKQKLMKSTESTKTIYTKPKIDQTDATLQLIIVPNPTNDKATITLKGSDSTNILEVSVYDRNGKLVKKEFKNGPTFSLSIANYVSGTYIIVAKDGENQFTGQLVVNH